jgi:hypothetical protein
MGSASLSGPLIYQSPVAIFGQHILRGCGNSSKTGVGLVTGSYTVAKSQRNNRQPLKGDYLIIKA